jgi:hypothetical protein
MAIWESHGSAARDQIQSPKLMVAQRLGEEPLLFSFLFATLLLLFWFMLMWLFPLLRLFAPNDQILTVWNQS